MDGYIATSSELATIIGLSDVRLRALSVENVIPKLERNMYDLREAIPAFVAYRVSLAVGDGSSMASEQERYVRLKADREELKLAVETGELGRVAEITSDYEDEVVKIRTAILSNLPRTLSLLPSAKSAREREILYRDAARKELEAISSDRN